MKDPQAHAKKIRSDAAECLVLSNLVSEEGRQLFARVAGHLNSLALEIETEAVIDLADRPSAAPSQQGNFNTQPADPSDYQKAVRSWRQLPWSLFLIVLIIAGVVPWAVSRTEFTFSTPLPKTGAGVEDLAHELATLLSEEREERRAFSNRLDAFIAQLDNLAKDINDLKSLRAGNPAPSTEGDIGQAGQSPGPEAKTPPAEEAGARAETSSSTASAFPAEAGQVPGSASVNTSPGGESSDQVGTVSATRTEADPRKPTIGPVGCTHFRSFDPVSGTYTTFDGRRRPCR